MKYTVIYTDEFETGLGKTDIVDYDYINCDEDNLEELLKSYDKVNFIFEGHCSEHKFLNKF